MKVHELFDNFSDDEILDNLVSLLPQYASYRDGYAEALQALRSQEPKFTDMCVYARGYVDPLGFPFHTVHGQDGTTRSDLEDRDGDEESEEEVNYVLCFRPWAEWLGMEIDGGTLGHFGQLDMTCVCLCEMTCHGFTEGEVAQAWTDLQERFDTETTFFEIDADKDIVDLLRRLADKDPKDENDEEE